MGQERFKIGQIWDAKAQETDRRTSVLKMKISIAKALSSDG